MNIPVNEYSLINIIEDYPNIHDTIVENFINSQDGGKQQLSRGV